MVATEKKKWKNDGENCGPLISLPDDLLNDSEARARSFYKREDI